MEEYLNTGIKQVIERFPQVAEILSAYDIGCGPCDVGTCLLKDIVAIHRLPPEQEKVLMARIAAVIQPGGAAPPAAAAPRVQTAPRKIRYSPPMRKLVDEHTLIKRWLALIPSVVERLDLEDAECRQVVAGGIDLIRSFADRYHHAKEEDILFGYFDQDTEMLRVMRTEHERARALTAEMAKGLERRDAAVVGERLAAYRQLLSEHIRKEDEILYPWMDSRLSDSQVGEIFGRFAEADRRTSLSPAGYEDFLARLEKRFNT